MLGRSWRRWSFGLATLFGAGRGYFIPYRYAADSPALRAYPALEPVFAAARPIFETVLARASAHVALFASFRGNAAPQPRFEQDWFPGLDGAIAYTMVRQSQPPRIVEVGSGHSTRFLARAVGDSGAATQITCIDPQPRAALKGLKVDWLRQTLQEAGSGPFTALQAGDMLFIDSSHILMPGSDVDILLNDIWPRLSPGVIVHAHDIVLPDAYPADWQWRGYNEQNALAPLLSGGARLLWSSHWVRRHMADAITRAGLGALPLPAGARETSLWLEKR
jgi:predicted O-methyltransferase YrrM